MARMIAEVCQALRSAVADLRSDVKLLKSMVGVNTGLLLIVPGKLFLPGM